MDGTLEGMTKALLEQGRHGQERNATPSVAIIDFRAPSGFDRASR
jgi:hypothetical protein